MMRGRHAALLRLLLGALLAAGALVATPTDAEAVQSNRHQRCQTRADGYAAQPHDNLTNAERDSRIAWLYEQCAKNDAADASAEEQGSLAPQLFPNRSGDRHGHPLHCMDLSDNRFGMHTNHNKPSPPPDPTAPGGTVQINVPGEFMYAYIDGAPRFLMRQVVWSIDDRAGNVISPVKMNMQPGGQSTQMTVALVPFTESFEPTSIWVELPEELATASTLDDIVLPGRRLANRTWIRPSGCHDKRAPMIIPQMLVDRMKDLGWTKANPSPRSARIIRFEADGNPNNASSWSLSESTTTVPENIQARGPYRWFFDANMGGGGGGGADTEKPLPTVDHSPNAEMAGPNVTLTGDASDNVGVDRVRIKVKDRDTGKWLKADGTWGNAEVYHETAVASPGAASTGWSISFDLPAGRFNPVVRAIDAAGNWGHLANFRPFEVIATGGGGGGPDTVDPVPTVDHARNDVFNGPNVTISGNATDNVGIVTVKVKIKDKATGKWLQPNGSFGNNPVYFSATVDMAGATSTTWSITKSLPNGDYNPVVKARDAAGNSGYLNGSMPIKVR